MLLPLLLLASAPTVAVLSTSHDTTELRFQPLAPALAPVVARLRNDDGAGVRGALLPGSRSVLVVTQLAQARDASWASSLMRLEEGSLPRVLAEGLALGSAPLITAEGRVFVARGRAGPETEQLRVDALSIDEVNPGTGKLRTVYSAKGSLLHLAGAIGREVVVYAIDERGGQLLAVHVDTLAVRTLKDRFAPLAHDFSVEGKRVLYTLGAQGSETYRVVSLEDGVERELARADSVALLPFALPDGRATWVPSFTAPVTVLGGGALFASHGAYDRLRFVRDGVAYGVTEVPGAFSSGFAVRLEGARALPFPTAPNARIELAGVTP
jgi:hypothetical protein